MPDHRAERPRNKPVEPAKKIITGRKKIGCLPGLLFCFLFLLPVAGFSENNSQLTLEAACQTALDKNENIQISREDVKQTKREVAVATSNLFPQINATASHIRKKELFSSDIVPELSTPTDYELQQVELDQHIYQLGKVWSGRKMAKYHLQKSRHSHKRTTREVLFQVCTAYYNVLLGRRSIEIAESSLARAKKQLERARAQFEVGVLTKNNVLRAEVQVAQAREQLERAKNQYQIARENLALEMGLDSPPRKLREPLPAVFPEKSLDALIQTALANRRDLRAAEESTLAAEERVEWERADFFPRISFHGEWQHTNEEAVFSGHDRNWQASLNLSYPLFTGGKNRAEYVKAKSALHQAKISRQRLKKSIRTEVRSIYWDLQTLRKVLEQKRAQVNSAKRNYKQVAAQFEEGLANSVDQVDAFAALNQAQNQLASAHYNYQLNLIKLKLATGTFQIPGSKNNQQPSSSAEAMPGEPDS